MASASRYARQIAFAPIGEEGQRRLSASRVAIVGAGAVGAAVTDQLARSGVGHLRVIDRDVLETSNLGRQALYTAEDAEQCLPKAVALARRARVVNPEVTIEPWVSNLDATNAERLLGDVDLVLDGTDNLDTRYVLNDDAVKRGRTWIYAGCVGSRGLTAVVIPGRTPCLRCVFPDLPPPGALETCETAGIIAPAANVVASIEAVEALKILVGAADQVRRTWISVELWPFRLTEVGGQDPKPRPDCPCCARRDFVFLRASREGRAATLCGRDAVHVDPGRAGQVDLAAMARRLAPLGSVKHHEYVLVFVTGGHEITIFEDGRALVKGTGDPAAARSLYDRYVGS